MSRLGLLMIVVTVMMMMIAMNIMIAYVAPLLQLLREVML